MDVQVIKSLKRKHADRIKIWIETGKRIKVDYPDNTEWIINKMLTEHCSEKVNEVLQPGKKVYSIKKFRQVLLKKIAAHL